MQFERELAVARRAAELAAEIIESYCGGERDLRQREKSWDSPVTAADLEANEAIERHLREAFPDDTILSEETVDTCRRQGVERLWIVDPLDGTKELIAGIPEFAVSVGLVVSGEPVVGCVYQPRTHECFWGAKEAGAFLDGQRIGVSKVDRLSDATMLASRTETSRGQVKPYSELFGRIEPTGSAALKLAHLACARGDLWLSTAPKNEWDVCAGDILVREAGGRYVDFDGKPRIYNQSDTLISAGMAAGNPALLDSFFARERERAAQ